MVFVLATISVLSYGPLAAYLVEMFPLKIRYSSLSLPYHIGFGIFGGMAPLIATYLIEKAECSSHFKLLFGRPYVSYRSDDCIPLYWLIIP